MIDVWTERPLVETAGYEMLDAVQCLFKIKNLSEMNV